MKTSLGVATGAFAIGEYPEGVAVMLFYRTANSLKAWRWD